MRRVVAVPVGMMVGLALVWGGSPAWAEAREAPTDVPVAVSVATPDVPESVSAAVRASVLLAIAEILKFLQHKDNPVGPPSGPPGPWGAVGTSVIPDRAQHVVKWTRSFTAPRAGGAGDAASGPGVESAPEAVSEPVAGDTEGEAAPEPAAGQADVRPQPAAPPAGGDDIVDTQVPLATSPLDEARAEAEDARARGIEAAESWRSEISAIADDLEATLSGALDR